jgi:hypothetical protein
MLFFLAFVVTILVSNKLYIYIKSTRDGMVKHALNGKAKNCHFFSIHQLVPKLDNKCLWYGVTGFRGCSIVPKYDSMSYVRSAQTYVIFNCFCSMNRNGRVYCVDCCIIILYRNGPITSLLIIARKIFKVVSITFVIHVSQLIIMHNYQI